MNTKSRKKENRNIPSSYSLTNKFVVFFTCMLIASLIFYVTGNFNHFLDSSLLLILRIIQASAVANIVLCFASLIQSFVFMIINKDLFYLIPLIPIVFALVLSFVSFFLAGTIHVIANGM